MFTTGTIISRAPPEWPSPGSTRQDTTSIAGYYYIDGETLRPGEAITRAGPVISLASNGATYYVNGRPFTVVSGSEIRLGTSTITATTMHQITTTTQTTAHDMGDLILSGLGSQQGPDTSVTPGSVKGDGSDGRQVGALGSFAAVLGAAILIL
jgi:hypothetical protein